MAQELLRIFDALDAAERARDVLLAAGFAPEAVQLQVRDDEAGPVAGNFTVGNNSVQGEKPDNHIYADNYKATSRVGDCMLIVHAPGAAQAARADALLAACGGRNIDAITGLSGR
jgi:hypothetical protein